MWHGVGKLVVLRHQTQMEQILHFVSRSAMDIDTVGQALIEQLIDKQLLKLITGVFL